MSHAAFYPTLCFYGLLFACALGIFVPPFVKPMRTAPEWMRRASWGAGFTLICVGVLNWLTVFESPHFSRLALHAVVEIKTLACGAGLALGILLYASTDYWRIYRDHKLAKKQQLEQHSASGS